LHAAAARPTKIVWHDGVAGPHVAVGPARLLDVVARAGDLVGVGSVEPHWFAGFTGAHQTLTVGVMKREDIEASHFHAMDAASRPCRLDGNPVHEGFVRVLDALTRDRRVVALNQVGPRWFGGAPLDSLSAAAEVARARWSRKVATPFDFLVAVVDPPLSRSLYQAEKGVKNSEFAVRDGGTIVLDAACEDGVGPARFVELLAAAPTESAARRHVAERGYRLGDHKAVRLRALQARGVRIVLVAPRFPADAASAAGIEVVADREAAARDLSGRGAVVRDAGNMIVEPA